MRDAARFRARSTSHTVAVRDGCTNIPLAAGRVKLVRQNARSVSPQWQLQAMSNPFRYFDSSPEVIRLVVMMYVRYPLSLRNVEDLLAERGIDICHETVRLWWNRFGPMFAAEIRSDASRSARLSPLALAPR